MLRFNTYARPDDDIEQIKIDFPQSVAHGIDNRTDIKINETQVNKPQLIWRSQSDLFANEN